MKNIKIIAPSSYIPGLKPEQLKSISTFFNKLNYKVSFGKYLFEKKYFLAGTDEERLVDLEDAFSDNSDLVLALRGGCGLLHLLDKIDYELISKHKKPFLGYSDSTAFQNALYAKLGMPSFSGFLAKDFFEGISPLTKKTLIQCLKNEKQIFKAPFLSKGKSSGILLGGNLRVFNSLLGTPYFPDMHNKILILEDVGEAPFQIDNMFMQLKLSGVFNQISGLILGDFSHLGTQKDERTLDLMIKEYFGNLPYPVVRFKKYSHEKNHVVIPLGGMVHLDSTKGTITLDKLKKFS